MSLTEQVKPYDRALVLVDGMPSEPQNPDVPSAFSLATVSRHLGDGSQAMIFLGLPKVELHPMSVQLRNVISRAFPSGGPTVSLRHYRDVVQFNNKLQPTSDGVFGRSRTLKGEPSTPIRLFAVPFWCTQQWFMKGRYPSALVEPLRGLTKVLTADRSIDTSDLVLSDWLAKAELLSPYYKRVVCMQVVAGHLLVDDVVEIIYTGSQ